MALKKKEWGKKKEKVLKGKKHYPALLKYA